MGKWEKIRIGDLFALEKGTLQSSKCTPGKYIFITAAEDWKTHREFSHDCEALVYAVAASGSLGRTHYVKGKFISSDLCFILTEKDKVKYPINFRFYQFIFSILRKAIVYSTKTGTSKEAINQKKFSDYLLPYIDIEYQNSLEKKMSKIQKVLNFNEQEFSNQSNYLSLLRQSILQEAIEGKLTQAWRKKNPVRKGEPDFDANALLEKIQEEKKKMAEGKSKKEKPLAPIKPEEIPFFLPEGWIWTRLGEIGLLERGKSKHRPRNDTSLFVNGVIPFVQTGEISQSKYSHFLIEKSKHYYNDKGLAQSKLWPAGTLCITIAANIAETGFLKIDACFPDSVVGFNSFFGNFTSCFVRYYVSSIQQQIIKFAPATAQKNINLKIISELIFPLPPLAEQQAIVARVDKLLAMVEELEKHVIEQKTKAEELMQAVLREAFD